MKLLFDTHAFLWWNFEPHRLSMSAMSACRDKKNNTLLLNVASAWEIQIKVGTGKLNLPDTLSRMIEREQEENGIILLPVDLPHILALEALPLHHKDPFDRLLVAQALAEAAHLVTADPMMHGYPVPVVW